MISSPGASADIDTVLEGGEWTAARKAITLLAALAVIFDGFDIQILGFAIPSIMREWHVARSAFAPIAALGLAGMALGSPFAGYCGDRFGRRASLICCVLTFGLATIATAFCTTLVELATLRAIAGAGVGGALPNAAALVAEFAPLRRRAMAVTLTIVCVPLGGMIAGVAAAQVLPTLGWHALYLIGGAAPLVFVLVLFVALPESPHYLSMRSGLSPETKNKSASPIRSLFEPTLRRDTLGLWVACFACMIGIYLVFGWLPAMLTARGLNIATASSGLATYNFGGVAGVLVCVAFVTALGSRRPLLWATAAGTGSAVALMFVHIVPAGTNIPLITSIGVLGFFANAAQTTLYALASHVYPTRIRASGVAWAAAIGRSGGMLSSLGGAFIIQAGSAAYSGVLAAAMAFTFLGLAIMRNHYPGSRSQPEPTS